MDLFESFMEWVLYCLVVMLVNPGCSYNRRRNEDGWKESMPESKIESGKI